MNDKNSIAESEIMNDKNSIAEIETTVKMFMFIMKQFELEQKDEAVFMFRHGITRSLSKLHADIELAIDADFRNADNKATTIDDYLELKK